jgi:Outer membrane protein beta-barrel domain
MKTIVTFVAIFTISGSILAQNDTLNQGKSKKDTTKIVVGRKEIKIVDTDQGTDIKVCDKKHKNWETHDTGYHEFKKCRTKGFAGHWAGIDLGLNNFVNKDHLVSLKGNDEFMSINSDRSLSVSINFFQHSIGLIGKNFGLVTGLGLEFNNYFFEHNNSIIKDSVGVISSKSYDPLHLDKSKLEATYLVVPLIFEVQFPCHVSRSKRFRLAAGVIGSLKLESHTKVEYKDNDRKQKNKNHDDFNMNFLRYGFTIRAGLNKINLFANYYPVSLFEQDKGPELYPFSVGLSFSFL